MRFAPLLALFVIASAACSSAQTSPSATGDAGAARAEVDAGGGLPSSTGVPDAAPRDAATDVKGQPTGTCPSAIGAFPEDEYFHPTHALTKGACTTTDLETLDKIGLGSYAARRTLVSPSCASCVYSDFDDAEWGLLVVVEADTALTNYAGCSIKAGDTRECVKMNSAWRFCTRRACGSCAPNASNACAESESTSGQCQTYYEADAECGGSWPAGCTSASKMITKYCGP